MTTINLRPWREEHRHARQQEFLIFLLIAALLGAFAVFLLVSWKDHQIQSQKRYNHALEQEIAALDEQIKEVKYLQEKRNLLVERMEVIQELQSNRAFVVQIFDELARAMPIGIYYEKLTREKNVIAAKGYASSNEDVAELLRRLDRSICFDNAMLANVKAPELLEKDNTKNHTSSNDANGNYFELSVHETSKQSEANSKQSETKELPTKTVAETQHAKL